MLDVPSDTDGIETTDEVLDEAEALEEVPDEALDETSDTDALAELDAVTELELGELLGAAARTQTDDVSITDVSTPLVAV